MDGEVELLRSKLQSVTLERDGQAEEVASQHRKLQDVQQKVCLGESCHGSVSLFSSSSNKSQALSASLFSCLD